ncbi:MAG: urease accessory protein UreE [Pseudomonadota bacterium]
MTKRAHDSSRVEHAEVIQITERADVDSVCQTVLTLPFEARRKSRQRVRLDDGRAAALLLPRGVVLRQGDMLRATDGTLIKVHAAPEQVSTASTGDPLLLARAAYHLGNRHVALQIGHAWLRYLHDHVLDEMVSDMGLEVRVECVPFEPESGAYSGIHVHHHAHD